MDKTGHTTGGSSADDDDSDYHDISERIKRKHKKNTNERATNVSVESSDDSFIKLSARSLKRHHPNGIIIGNPTTGLAPVIDTDVGAKGYDGDDSSKGGMKNEVIAKTMRASPTIATRKIAAAATDAKNAP